MAPDFVDKQSALIDKALKIMESAHVTKIGLLNPGLHITPLFA